MKYMVMECHLSYAVVLSEDGRFLKVANRQYEVGQTVTDIIEMQAPRTVSEKKKTSKWRYSLAAMAACLVLVVASLFQMAQMPYASVYMSINPEVRIDVNRWDVVVGLEGVNADGEDLTEGYRYEKKDLELVMDELVDRAIEMGYLHEGGQITLTLDADSEEWVITHNDALTIHLNQQLSERVSVTIEVTDKKAQTNQIVIPAGPGTNDYGASDYEDPAPSLQPSAPPPQPADSGYGDSAYDDGQTDYGDPIVPDDPVQSGTVWESDSAYDSQSSYGSSADDSGYGDNASDYD